MDETNLKELRTKILSSNGIGVVMTLHINKKPMNLKALAKYTGMKETTTLNYIKQLLQDDIIEIDSKATASSRGKYYRLTSLATKLLKERELDEQEKELEDEIFSDPTGDKMAESIIKNIENGKFENLFTQFTMVQNINNVVETNLIQKLQLVFEDLQAISDASMEEKKRIFSKHKLPVSPISIGIRSFKISNPDQMKKFNAFIQKYLDDAVALSEEFDSGEDHDNVFYQYVYTSILPVIHEI
ncbi:MAG: hypothetical protein INQ03_19780 [Candidatus Heimdallarchaeota archaeon]|nr:hypothetical protein [Candidatus Heimdallarchaeota archaeon]